MKNGIRTLIAFILGLVAGMLVAWLYWQQRIEGHEIHIHTLQTLLREKERKLKKLKEQKSESRPAAEAKPRAAASSFAVEAQASQIEPDDLKRIEGIGPKISQVLQQAGLTTYEQLAHTDVDELTRILKEAQVRIAAPDTWPEQASLAAAGDWEGLQALQDQLQGGRRV